MKLSALLASRPTILRQAALAHAAAAWFTLHNASWRIATGGLHGHVRLRHGENIDGEAPWALLTSDEIQPSVLEEHFTEDEVLEIADALAYATDAGRVDVTFRIETLGEVYAAPLLQSLEKAGVTLDINERSTDPTLG